MKTRDRSSHHSSGKPKGTFQITFESVRQTHLLWLYVLIMSRTRFRWSTLHSCVNVKKLLARSRREIRSLSPVAVTLTLHCNTIRNFILLYWVGFLPKKIRPCYWELSLVPTAAISSIAQIRRRRLMWWELSEVCRPTFIAGDE